MTKYQRPLFLILLVFLTIAANAQEQPARTWAGGGFAITKSTARSGPTIAGAYVDTAYDLRHGLQVRGSGEYRRGAAIPRLFTGDGELRGKSELRYAGALVYHFSREGDIRPMIAGGVQTIRHFFELTGRPSHNYERARTLYNSSVNPLVTVGASLGRRNEVAFTKYLADTYSYSNLRGVGGDFSYTRKLAGLLHLRGGVRARIWTYREGTESRERKAGEVSGFVGFHFQ